VRGCKSCLLGLLVGCCSLLHIKGHIHIYVLVYIVSFRYKYAYCVTDTTNVALISA